MRKVPPAIRTIPPWDRRPYAGAASSFSRRSSDIYAPCTINAAPIATSDAPTSQETGGVETLPINRAADAHACSRGHHDRTPDHDRAGANRSDAAGPIDT